MPLHKPGPRSIRPPHPSLVSGLSVTGPIVPCLGCSLLRPSTHIGQKQQITLCDSPTCRLPACSPTRRPAPSLQIRMAAVRIGPSTATTPASAATAGATAGRHSPPPTNLASQELDLSGIALVLKLVLEPGVDRSSSLSRPLPLDLAGIDRECPCWLHELHLREHLEHKSKKVTACKAPDSGTPSSDVRGIQLGLGHLEHLPDRESRAGYYTTQVMGFDCTFLPSVLFCSMYRFPSGLVKFLLYSLSLRATVEGGPHVSAFSTSSSELRFSPSVFIPFDTSRSPSTSYPSFPTLSCLSFFFSYSPLPHSDDTRSAS